MTNKMIVTLGTDTEKPYEIVNLELNEIIDDNVNNHQPIRLPESFDMNAFADMVNVNEVVSALADELMALVGEYTIEKSRKMLNEFSERSGHSGVDYKLYDNEHVLRYVISVIVSEVTAKEIVKEVEVPVDREVIKEVVKEVEVPVDREVIKEVVKEVPVKVTDEPIVEKDENHGQITSAQKKGLTAKTLPPLFENEWLTNKIGFHSAFVKPITKLRLVINVFGAKIEVTDERINDTSFAKGGEYLDDVTEILITTYKRLAHIYKIKEFDDIKIIDEIVGDTATIVFEKVEAEEVTEDEKVEAEEVTEDEKSVENVDNPTKNDEEVTAVNEEEITAVNDNKKSE